MEMALARCTRNVVNPGGWRMKSCDDLLDGFITDASQRLEAAESACRDLAAGYAMGREALDAAVVSVNIVKGAAGFFGFANSCLLAGRLENALRLLESGGIEPGSSASLLAEGFALLRSLVEDGQAGDTRDISLECDSLASLAAGHPPAGTVGTGRTVSFTARPGGPAFTLDRLSLEQALTGGRNVYLVEYDLARDVLDRGKTPLGILSVMASCGVILASTFEHGREADPNDLACGRAFFHLLYSTIVDPDVARYLFVLDASQVRHLAHSEFADDAEAAPAPGIQVLELAGEADSGRMEELRRSLMGALGSGHDVAIDMSRAGHVGAAFAQLVCSAHKTAQGQGLRVLLSNVPEAARERLRRLGFSGSRPDSCPPGVCQLREENRP